MDDSEERQTANLRAELTRWRTRRKLSLRALAVRLKCDHSHLWKIENGKATFSRTMAESCDHALDAGGALIAAWVNARTSVRPAQLPAAHGQVVGRDAQLAELNRAASDHRSPNPLVIAIVGPVGAGKTALALRWAHQVADRFADGQLYADMSGFASSDKPVSAKEVLEAFLTALGATAIPTTMRERAALYRSLLAERKILIVLDNIAGDSDLEYLLPGSAGCAVVLISRRILNGLVSHVAGTRVTVGPLAGPDSISLVTGLVGDARARAAPDAVIRLTRICDHLPLALRAVAEHVTLYPHRPIDALLDELTDADDQLAIAETEELHSAFSWSYQRLAPDAARLFRLLGLHTGQHLSVSAVAALADLTTPKARRLLHQLASLHLITIDSDQMIQLDNLTHAYARRLITTEHDHELRGTAIQRLASWYLTAVHAAGRRLLPSTFAETACEAQAHEDGGNGVGHGASAAHDMDGTVFADDRAARAWCDTHLGDYGALMRLALAHDPDRRAPQLAAELGRIGLLRMENLRPDPPADRPSTPRHDAFREANSTRRSTVESGQPNPPSDRPPDDHTVGSEHASRHPRDDPRADTQRDDDSPVEIRYSADDERQDPALVERLREATARLIRI